MNPPKVFISYSHESENHDNWVNSLSKKLREGGIDVVLDQWDLHPGQDITNFMEKGLIDADRVLVVCSSTYILKANENKGGVGYEKMIVNADILKDISSIKYIPIIPFGVDFSEVPTFLGARLYIDFRDPNKFVYSLEKLIREIHLGYVVEKPKLGASPFEKKNEENLETNERTLDIDWYKKHAEKSYDSLNRLGYKTFLEVISYPLSQIRQIKQQTILEAVRGSQIHTFGWPIGIIIDSNDESRPKPLSDGVFSEIISDNPNHKSYDYWAINTSGTFYLIKSLFEDLRDPEAIYFNTRIVRNAEVLLFCQKLYTLLGVDENCVIDVGICYSGLKERFLKSSTSSRYFHPKKTYENEIKLNVNIRLKDISENIVHLTKELSQPLFNIFEFTEIADSVYEQIVTDFIKGKVT